MPKAAKSKSRPTSSTNPLSAKSGNAAKAAAHTTANSRVNEKAAQEKTVTAPKQAPDPNTDNEPNYLLTVAMILSHDPMITRFLSVPPTLTFDKFHQVLQIAFGWANCHMHAFNVEVEVEVEVKKDRIIPQPVLILQNTLDGDDDDLGFWPKPQNEKKWTLRDVFEREEWEKEDGKKIKVSNKPGAQLHLRYEYDIGDGWDHQINLLGRAEKNLHDVLGGPGAPAILCLGGEGHPCAEDCGSEPGWEDLKDAFKKSRGDKERKDWYKTVCANGDPKGLDPYRWDMFEVNDELAKVKA
ncbi:MAG: hypothetical protein Q9209_005935 [Squamulea sp. 1 TL-2023]